MQTPSLDLLGVVVAHPTTCLTNLLLSVECLAFGGWLRATGRASSDCRVSLRRGDGSRWAGFFFLLSLGTFLGAAKHGIAHLLPLSIQGVVTVSSGFAGMAAILVAELAVVRAWGAEDHVNLGLRRAAIGKFLLFGSFHLMVWSFLVVAANAAVGLLFLLPASHRAFQTGRLGFDRISLGWGVLILAAVPYLLNAAPSPWFDHVDMAHVVMMAGLVPVFLGAMVSQGLGPEIRSEAATVPSSPPMEV